MAQEEGDKTPGEEGGSASSAPSPDSELVNPDPPLNVASNGAFSFLKTLRDGRKVNNAYQELHGVIDQLDERVEVLLADQESEFLLAHRTKIHRMEEQIRDLKEKADAGAAIAAKSKKLHNLQLELEWFIQEALRLDEQCKTKKIEIETWRAKAEALEEDKKVLEEQVKALKRQTRGYNDTHDQEVGLALCSGTPIPVSPTRLMLAGFEDDNLSSDKFPKRKCVFQESNISDNEGRPLALPPPVGEPVNQRSRCASEPSLRLALSRVITKGEIDWNCRILKKRMPDNQRHRLSIVPQADPFLQRRFIPECNLSVVRMKALLEKEKRTNRELRERLAQHTSQRSQLEELFLRCAEDVREKVRQQRKKRDPGQSQTKSKAIKDADLVSISLQSFTQAERKMVVEQLLSSDDALTYLYEKIFPFQPNATSVEADGREISQVLGRLAIQPRDDRFIPPC